MTSTRTANAAAQ